MKKLKLFPKTILYVTSLMLIIALISHALIYLLMPLFYTNQKKSDIERDTGALISLLESIPEDEYIEKINQFENNSDITVMLSNGSNSDDGKEIWQFYNNDTDENGKEFYKDSTKDGISISTSLSQDNIVVEKTFTSIQNNIYHIKTIIPLEPVNEALDVVLTLLPITLIICIIISTIFAFIYSRAITKPIKVISAVARRMEQLDKKAYCSISSSDEIGTLADDLNSLYNNLLTTIDRLENEISKVSEAEQSKVDFLRTASHELKTPVTAVSGMLEGMICNVGRYIDRDTYLIECKNQIDELSLLIKEILDASKLDMLATYKKTEDVHLGELIQEVIEPYELISKSKRINFSYKDYGAFSVHIPKELFSKALSNVVSNAVNYTDSEKLVRIYFKGQSIVIENECTPVDENILTHLSEPFYRPGFDHNHVSGGNGLGLYITDKILSICNIEYEFKSMENSSGMQFIIYF